MIEPFVKNDKVYRSKLIRTCDDCGDKAVIRPQSIANRKTEKHLCWHCGQKYRVLPKGPNHGSFKHGLDVRGYKRITIEGVRSPEHKIYAEASIGRSLVKGEEIHHIDFDKLNNSPENLYVCPSNSYHTKLMSSMQRLGFGFFGKGIWFNLSSKTYTLTPSVSTPPKESTDPYVMEKTYIKYVRGTPYVMYLAKRDDYKDFAKNNWRRYQQWKRFHVAVMESHLGRKLKPNECIHHINGNTLDNSLINLCLVSKKEHSKTHASLLQCSIELYRRGLIVFENGGYLLAVESKT